MRKLITICSLAVGLALSGCATIHQALGVASGFQVNEASLSALEAGYGPVLVAMLEYRCRYDNAPAACVDQRGNRIPENPCRAGQGPSLDNGFCANRAVVIRMQNADRAVQAAFDKVEDNFAACQVAPNSLQCSSLVSSWNTMQTAIATARAVAAEIGFRG